MARKGRSKKEEGRKLNHHHEKYECGEMAGG
jgi:hypothetical protein